VADEVQPQRVQLTRWRAARLRDGSSSVASMNSNDFGVLAWSVRFSSTYVASGRQRSNSSAGRVKSSSPSTTSTGQVIRPSCSSVSAGRGARRHAANASGSLPGSLARSAR
jgi:hypothetical protein